MTVAYELCEADCNPRSGRIVADGLTECWPTLRFIGATSNFLGFVPAALSRDQSAGGRRRQVERHHQPEDEV
jgi:hypothetical protein